VPLKEGVIKLHKIARVGGGSGVNEKRLIVKERFEFPEGGP